MSMLSNAKKSIKGPGPDPGGIVRSVNFTSVADQPRTHLLGDNWISKERDEA